MPVGDEELLIEMRSTLDSIRAASELARRRAHEARTTVQDKEKLLSVIVGGYGELRGLTFHGDAYRDLAPAELADLIVKTVAQARDGAQRAAVSHATEVAGDLFGLGDVAQRATSIDELIEGVVSQVSAGGRKP